LTFTPAGGGTSELPATTSDMLMADPTTAPPMSASTFRRMAVMAASGYQQTAAADFKTIPRCRVERPK
jgi:hypothetical protein